MEIESQSSYNVQIAQMLQEITNTSNVKTGQESQNSILGSGDTVQISEEARALLEEYLAQYKNKPMEELTEAESQEIAEVFREALGLDSAENSADSASTAGASSAEGAASGEATAAPASGAGASGGAQGSSSTEDEIEELEEKIKEVEQEISALSGKAKNDPSAETELKVKQVELASLEAQLAELETQQTSS